MFSLEISFFACRDHFSGSEFVFQTGTVIFPEQNPCFTDRIRFSGAEFDFHALAA
jgi:hypothetical protein